MLGEGLQNFVRYRELLRKVAKRLASQRKECLPSMEPPYWYYPVRQSLAVALMQAAKRRSRGAVPARANVVIFKFCDDEELADEG